MSAFLTAFPGVVRAIVTDVGFVLGTTETSTRVVKSKSWQPIYDDVIYLNDEIIFYDDSSSIVFIHLDIRDQLFSLR